MINLKEDELVVFRREEGSSRKICALYKSLTEKTPPYYRGYKNVESLIKDILERYPFEGLLMNKLTLLTPLERVVSGNGKGKVIKKGVSSFELMYMTYRLRPHFTEITTERRKKDYFEGIFTIFKNSLVNY